MVRIGIIGCGSLIGIARNHIAAYQRCKDAQITALYDLIEGRAAGYIEKLQLPEARACQSLEELFSLMNDCYQMKRMRAAEKNLDFIFENDPDMPDEIAVVNWYALAGAEYVPFIPFFSAMTEIYEPFANDLGDDTFTMARITRWSYDLHLGFILWHIK